MQRRHACDSYRSKNPHGQQAIALKDLFHDYSPIIDPVTLHRTHS
jgi:hypothetical protein